MKKMIALLFTMMMIFSLVSCGGKKEVSTDNNTESSQQTAEETSKPAENKPAKETASEKKDGFNLLEADESKRVSDLVITEMKTDKTSYGVGEEINLTLKWTGTPDSSAWVGIIPAEVPHGDEYVNDDADLEYIYLTDHEGAFVFTIELEPGMYTLRVNETDGGGAELAWCAFKVNGKTTVEAEKGELTGWLTTKTGRFYSQFTDGLYMEYETSYEGMEMHVITASKGDKSYTQNTVNGTSVAVSVMDGKDLYTIDHASKTVIKMTLDTTAQNMTNTLFEEKSIDPAKLIEGTREIDGVTYDTEEWVIDGAKSILCFDGDDLAYIVGVAEGEEITMRIVDISDNVNEGLFVIPSNYEIISY